MNVVIVVLVVVIVEMVVVVVVVVMMLMVKMMMMMINIAIISFLLLLAPLFLPHTLSRPSPTSCHSQSQTKSNVKDQHKNTARNHTFPVNNNVSSNHYIFFRRPRVNEVH